MNIKVGLLLMLVFIFMGLCNSSKIECKEKVYSRNKNIEIQRLERDSFINCSSLESLSLNMVGLTTLDSNVFERTQGLKRIAITMNHLKSLNKSLTFAINLEIIDFSNNKIQSIEKEDFEKNTKLKKIILDSNEIISVDERAFKSLEELEQLSLECNQLTEFPAIDTLYLHLASNKIEKLSIGRKTFSLEIPDNKLKTIVCPDKMDIIYFDARNNSLSDWTCLLKMKSLEYLIVSQNYFTSTPKTCVTKTLKLLAVSFNNVSWEIENFYGFKTIKYLSVANLPSYKRINEVLPSLEVLQLDVSHFEYSNIKSLYCELQKQEIQLDSIDSENACYNCRRFLHSENQIHSDHKSFFDTNLVYYPFP